MEDFLNSTIFKEALANVRMRLAYASSQEYNLFGQPWFTKHFSWGTQPHTEESFSTILEDKHIEVAASTINGRSGEPLRTTEGFGEIKQRMFTHAHGYTVPADKIRKLLLLEGKIQNARLLKYIEDELMMTIGKAVKGVNASYDIMALYLLSHKGEFEFTKDNDPGSPFIGSKVSFGIDQNHCATATDAGSAVYSEANLANIDPFKLIQDVQNEVGYNFSTVLIDPEYHTLMLRSPRMQSYINSVQTVNAPLTSKKLDTFFADNGLPKIEVVRRHVKTQDGNVLSTYNPWKKGQMVLLPTDMIGTIETAYTDAELGMKSPGVDYSYYGRIEVSQYKTGERENTEYTEVAKARSIGAPSIDVADQIYCIDLTA